MAALSGIKVLDMSRVLAGPWCGQVLSDLGADVIKVERPHIGDDTRTWTPPAIIGKDDKPTTESSYYCCANRGKRSIAVNLASKEGQDLIKRLVLDCDILIENYKVGQLAKYGLDYETISKINPKLIYCSITGYGQTGPYAKRAGYDYAIQAESGLMSVTGERDDLPGGGPMRCGVAFADLFTGSYAVVGILAALHQRHSTGRGQHIDMALFDTMVALLANQTTYALIGNKTPVRTGKANAAVCPYGPFKGSDRHFLLAVGNNLQFERFCKIAGCEELLTDPRFATNTDRLANRDALEAIIENITKTRPAAEWIKLCSDNAVPSAPINTVTEALNDPHLISRGMRIELPHPLAKEGKIPLIGCPVHMSDSAPAYHRAPPYRAQHTDEVLQEFGLSPEEIAKLREVDAVE